MHTKIGDKHGHFLETNCDRTMNTDEGSHRRRGQWTISVFGRLATFGFSARKQCPNSAVKNAFVCQTRIFVFVRDDSEESKFRYESEKDGI